MKSLVQKIDFLNQEILESLSISHESGILAKLTKAGVSVTGASFGFVWFKEKNHFQLAYKSQRVPFKPLPPRKNGSTRSVMRTKKSLLIDDYLRSKYIRPDGGTSIKSVAVIPIFFKHKTYGSIVICFRQRHRFSKEDRILLEFLGNSVARSITINRLYASLSNFKSTLDRTLDSIMIFDSITLKIGYMNQGSTALTGYKRNELMKSSIVSLLTLNEDKFRETTKALIKRKKRSMIFETNLLTKSGNTLPVEMFLQLVSSADGSEKFLSISHNITVRKNFETQIQKLLEQKNEFLGVASHELRTPVTTIKGFTQLLQKKLRSQDPEVEHFLQKISSQVDKLDKLVNELLDFSKIEAGKLIFEKKQIDLNELVRDVVENLQLTNDGHRIILNGIVSSSILGDWNGLSQVFTNIITNAIKYSPESDKVIVRLSEKDGPVVSIEDFGPGIPGKQKEQIFQRFFQGKPASSGAFPGLGLGLYISKEIVKRHNGNIWFENKNPNGTTFFVRLPVANQQLL
ncbi:MAG: ATP-binding protein [bacterium]|nr:ATP-binding protein [bacterium]